jgi:hypothetical protein
LLPAPTLRPLWLVSSRLASAFPRWSVIADVHAPCGFARRSALCAWRASGWMPSGARSPWAAADPCFRTRSRRYPSFRLPAPAECQALLRRSGFPRLSRLLLRAGRKKPSVGVSPLSGGSLPTGLSPGRTNAAVRRGEMLSVILSSLHRAGWRPKPARALHRGKRCRSALLLRSRRPQFCTSASSPKTPAGWLRCKLSVVVSLLSLIHISEPTRPCH